MDRYLTILEVSQKQAYIFSSNKLAENVKNSNTIAWITSPEYIEETVADKDLFSEEENLVYAGGGHTILEFASEEQAKTTVSKITARILREIPEIEMFAATMEYDANVSPAQNVQNLTAALERKKAVRAASFHQRTFGVEAVDRNTGKAKMVSVEKPAIPLNEEWVPDGFARTYRLEELGGSESNFIAIVHIDGNAMGKRVEDLSRLPGMDDWAEYKKKMAEFSRGITNDFIDAYHKMEEKIAACMKNSEFFESLAVPQRKHSFLFPVRRIIAEGDDICFVANGKIGIECAVTFINALTQKSNMVDGKQYAACAGVALVHQKYPFYRAYELAEELCSNAKKFGASLSADGSGSDISCIDWHIEYGEIQDTLEDTRRQFMTDDGKQLEMRPYIVTADSAIEAKEPVRRYENFRSLMKKIFSNDFYGRGLMKGLRPVLKQGESAVKYYLTFHKAEEITRDAYHDVYQPIDYESLEIGSGEQLERPVFIKTEDGKERSTLFDAIEIMDVYHLMEEDA